VFEGRCNLEHALREAPPTPSRAAIPGADRRISSPATDARKPPSASVPAPEARTRTPAQFSPFPCGAGERGRGRGGRPLPARPPPPRFTLDRDPYPLSAKFARGSTGGRAFGARQEPSISLEKPAAHPPWTMGVPLANSSVQTSVVTGPPRTLPGSSQSALPGHPPSARLRAKPGISNRFAASAVHFQPWWPMRFRPFRRSLSPASPARGRIAVCSGAAHRPAARVSNRYSRSAR
jgi:hypothetical protein